MTTTLTRPEISPQVAVVDDAGAVLRHLDHALGALAQLDPDLFHSHTAAGRAVVDLAGAARATVALLGHDAGAALGAAAGVVVVRDLVAARGLLHGAVLRGGCTAPESLLAARRRADLAYGRFLVSAPATD